MSKRHFLWVLGASLLVVMGCNLAPVNSQNENLVILQSTGTPSHPVEISPIPILEDSWSVEVNANIQTIFARGQVLGNRANVFSKVGDSITVSHHFLYPFGIGNYQLGDYTHLQNVIDFYSQANARQGNSFINPSLVATEGWAAWAALSPEMADASLCLAGESPLACELRIVRPSVALIMYGTNDVGYRSQNQYYEDLSAIVRYCIERGTIPILSTFPNRPDVASQSLVFNEIVRYIAEEQKIPYVDFYQASINLPNYGLTFDNVHPSAPSSVMGGAGSFNSDTLQYGYPVRNLLSLEALHTVMQVLDL